jgi:hypothetical protein
MHRIHSIRHNSTHPDYGILHFEFRLKRKREKGGKEKKRNRKTNERTNERDIRKISMLQC